MKEPILYRITRPVIKVLFIAIFRPTYKGLKNIPKEGRVVLAGNHTSNLDCLLLISSTKRTIHFLAKDDIDLFYEKINEMLDELLFEFQQGNARTLIPRGDAGLYPQLHRQTETGL